MAKYKVSDIIFRNKAKGFLCQNSPCSGSLGEGCQCALLSLWNYLVLEGDVPWQDKAEDGYITQKVIRNYIAQRYLEVIDNLKKEGYLAKNYGEKMRRGMKLIDSLSTGIKMDDAAWLFGALDVDLVHGDVVDPKASDETTKMADSTSSEASKEGQLTSYGLNRLLQRQEEGKLRVLYRNGHYSVLLKQEEILLTLETDEAVLKDLPTAIVDGDSFYLTSRFSPTKNQRNIEKWYDQNLKDKFGEEETWGTSKQLPKEARNARKFCSPPLHR